jgi:hypothetical protein
MDSLNQRIERLLPSQKFWMLAHETERVNMGGWRAGKTRILCTTGMLLSYLVPDNFGFIGRASGKDLHSTTIPTFFDEVCPSDMIVGRPKKVGQSGLEVTLRTRYEGRTSKIYFDYVIDKQTKKSHLAGGNWGWFGVDQLEEIGRGDWYKLMGRLSRTYMDPVTGQRKTIKTHALGVGNQIGHDWIFEDFFEGGDYLFDTKNAPKTFFKTVHRDHRLGVIVRSEENMASNGGFVPDEYFTNLRRTMPPQWCARYMDGSFDDFSGKIYGDYNLSSVHNIVPFKIPSHWPWYCYIDPGGSVPWAIGVWRTDEAGNKIIVNSADEVYAKLRLNPNEAVKWIKQNVPIDKTRFIIDYQNIPVMQIFQDEGIHCEPAMKDVHVGINGAMSEFYVNPEFKLPVWYKDTQPKSMWEKFYGKGAPKVYGFNTCKSWSKEHDNYIWDPVRKNVPKEGQADHHCDGTRYYLASSPQPAPGIIRDPYAEYRNSDPTTAFHLDQVSREIARLTAKDRAANMRNQEAMDGGIIDEDGRGPEFISEFSGYN